MYFENFPKVKYLFQPAKFGSPDVSVLLTDITKNVRFKKNVMDNITLYDYYTMREGETFEVVSEKLYGTPDYHWILMLLNDAYDWRQDLPLISQNFNEYIIDKYGSVETAMSQIHHYENSEGFVVDSDYLNANNQLDATPVTMYEWEELQNEAKRRIKVVSLEMIDKIATNFKDLM
jgi:hypothetical protein